MGFAREYETRIDAFIGQFLSVRLHTEELCRPLMHEDLMLSVSEDTSPPKWHLAHTSWFFENFILRKLATDYEPFRVEFNFLFDSHHRKSGVHLSKEKRNVLSRPSALEVFEYRRVMTKKVTEAIHRMSVAQSEKILPLLELGINHEQQHQELLLMDIKRNFYENPMRPKYHLDHAHGRYNSSDVLWHNLPSSLSRIGVPKDSGHFALENERDAHYQWIESCMISSHLVTNEEYIAFIEEGGYDNPLLWLSDGWELKEREGWTAPLYWEKNGQEWWCFTLGGMMPVDPAAPVVHVSYYEAVAFAQWKGARLPTEFEWETAAKLEKSECTFMENNYFEPEPPLNDHEIFSQIHGGVWEWTQSAYLPYPRFEKYQQGPSEYDGKFMCNRFVLRGGSCVTPRSHYRVTYRNFYHPQDRWQYAGIRLAKDLA